MVLSSVCCNYSLCLCCMYCIYVLIVSYRWLTLPQSKFTFRYKLKLNSALKTLYKNSNSSLNDQVAHPPDLICLEVKQGCPASPYLFLIVAQLLAYHVKACAVKGISLLCKELIETQLADDTLFLKNESQIPEAINKEFSRISDLRLNIFF